MSRIGKLPITIPNATQVEITEQAVIVKGPKGELTQAIPSDIRIKVEENIAYVTGVDESKQTETMRGTIRALLANMVTGVTEGFKKELEVIGVGYKAAIEGKNLKLNVGYSHPVLYSTIAGVEIKTQDNRIEITGVNKELVGKVASEIRKIKRCNPYSGKGIKYSDEKVRRKAGKAAKTGSSFK